MQTDLITKVYFNEHLTHSCVGMPQSLQALSSSLHMHWPRFSLKLVVTCVINCQAGTKLIRHGEERDGFVTLNTAAIKNVMTGLKGSRGYRYPFQFEFQIKLCNKNRCQECRKQEKTMSNLRTIQIRRKLISAENWVVKDIQGPIQVMYLWAPLL